MRRVTRSCSRARMSAHVDGCGKGLPASQPSAGKGKKSVSSNDGVGIHYGMLGAWFCCPHWKQAQAALAAQQVLDAAVIQGSVWNTF